MVKQLRRMTSWSVSYAQGKDKDMFEKVNPAHPDKIADRIAGALVDMAYALDENPRIAVEVLIGARDLPHHR